MAATMFAVTAKETTYADHTERLFVTVSGEGNEERAQVNTPAWSPFIESLYAARGGRTPVPLRWTTGRWYVWGYVYGPGEYEFRLRRTQRREGG